VSYSRARVRIYYTLCAMCVCVCVCTNACVRICFKRAIDEERTHVREVLQKGRRKASSSQGLVCVCVCARVSKMSQNGGFILLASCPRATPRVPKITASSYYRVYTHIHARVSIWPASN